MENLLFILNILAIIAGLLILMIIYTYLNSMSILNKKIKKEKNLILSDNKYILFNHKNDSGIGLIYNEGTIEEPEYFVLCCFDSKSVQHLKLNEIDNYKIIRNEQNYS